MFNIFKKKLKKEKEIIDRTKPPKGWYVHEAGQDPLHMLWYVVLINFDDVCNSVENPRHHVSEEKNSFQEALTECSTKCK